MNKIEWWSMGPRETYPEERKKDKPLTAEEKKTLMAKVDKILRLVRERAR